MAKKKHPDALALALLVQGQLAAMNLALESICLALFDRRTLIEEFFDEEIDELVFSLQQEFPEPVSVGADLWSESFLEFLRSAEEATDPEPPDAANDPEG